jgi:hypothetical protein
MATGIDLAELQRLIEQEGSTTLATGPTIVRTPLAMTGPSTSRPSPKASD